MRISEQAFIAIAMAHINLLGIVNKGLALSMCIDTYMGMGEEFIEAIMEDKGVGKAQAAYYIVKDAIKAYMDKKEPFLDPEPIGFKAAFHRT